MRKKTVIYNAFACLIAISLIFSLSSAIAYSSSASELDLNTVGSISVTMRDGNSKETVAGGNLTIYHVAGINIIDNSLNYIYSEEFKDYGQSLDDLNNESLAKGLAAYVNSKSLKGTTIDIADNGVVKFDNLYLGLYLVIQNEPSSGYYAVNPFLVSVPLSEKGSWIYDVDASPKVEMYKQITTTKPAPIDSIPKPGGKLPQTGQLNWPVPVLAISGVVLFTIGWILFTKKRKNNDAS